MQQHVSNMRIAEVKISAIRFYGWFLEKFKLYSHFMITIL